MSSGDWLVVSSSWAAVALAHPPLTSLLHQASFHQRAAQHRWDAHLSKFCYWAKSHCCKNTKKKHSSSLSLYFITSSCTSTQNNTQNNRNSLYIALTKPFLPPLLLCLSVWFASPSPLPRLFDIIGRDQCEKGGPTICNSSLPRLICLRYFALGER